MKIQKLVIGILLVVVGVGIVLYGLSLRDTDTDSSQATPENVAPQETIADSTPVDPPFVYSQSGELEDVSGGDASGTAQAGFDDSEYLLSVEMESLPPVTDGYFYEGWVVNQETTKFISTGEIEQETGDAYTNTFAAEQDYTDYDFYVLTLEPDDGDPAPAEHILEGKMN